METLKYYIKKFWVVFPLILLSLFIFTVGIIRTNQAIILKGDTVKFTSVVNLDTNYTQKGSFSTIYVSSLDKTTILQNWIANGLNDCETYTMSESSTHLNDLENYQAGKIQYNSSIGNALVLAYTEAKKENPDIYLDYHFVGFDVTFYSKESKFRIGDRLYGMYVKGFKDSIVYAKDNEAEFKNALNYLNSITKEEAQGSYFLVKRGNDEITIEYGNQASLYGIYEWNSIKSNPTFSVSSNMIGGPSGGLLQTLSIYNQLVEEDLTHGLKIAGTGTISATGTVGAIGGVKEKVPTAYEDHVDIFFCVEANYEEAKEAYSHLPNEKMKLIPIKTFYDALDYLRGGVYSDFGIEK